MQIDTENFRNYHSSEKKCVKELYKKLRTKQTVDYVKKMKDKFTRFEERRTTPLSVWEIFEKLDKFVDSSDPDIDLPNSIHNIQTAEGLRKDGYPDWMQLVGLLHDFGKIIFIFGNDKEGTTVKEQWGVVGDTFVVGCKIPDKVVFPEFNGLNPDMSNPQYNTKLGIYKENCGLDNCLTSWGHDEYLYQILKYNKQFCKNETIPDIGLDIIRYHSLYPWHHQNTYEYLENSKDKETKKWVKEFNHYDLYTKINNTSLCDFEELKQVKAYYQTIIDKYLPPNGILFI